MARQPRQSWRTPAACALSRLTPCLTPYFAAGPGFRRTEWLCGRLKPNTQRPFAGDANAPGTNLKTGVTVDSQVRCCQPRILGKALAVLAPTKIARSVALSFGSLYPRQRNSKLARRQRRGGFEAILREPRRLTPEVV